MSHFKCALVAKRKSLFDDKEDEIQQLTFIIKQDLASLNQQIAHLQQVISDESVPVLVSKCDS